MLEFQQFQHKIRRELRARMKFSKDLLELRDKEAKLVRMKRYEEAEKVKMKAEKQGKHYTQYSYTIIECLCVYHL